MPADMSDITIKTYDPDRPDASVTTVEELDGRLDQLAAECRDRPIIVDLVNAEGDCLTMGLGADHTAIAVRPAQGGALMESIGDEAADPAAHTVFFYGGQWTGVLKRDSVPVALARQEVRRWFQERKVDGPIRWRSR
jgi:hypothetical protein